MSGYPATRSGNDERRWNVWQNRDSPIHVSNNNHAGSNQFHQGEYNEENDFLDRIDIYAIVDAWRSYRNDTTNLQNTAGYVSYDYAHQNQWPSHTAQQFNFNPAATWFQPTNQTMSDFAQSNSAMFQPLRHSSGRHEVLHQQQTRNLSTGSNPRPTNRYALRSQTSNTWQNTLVASIEQSANYSSSIPINLTPAVHAKTRTVNRSPSVTPPPEPIPQSRYISQASLTPTQLAEPQKLLIVVDLNGTLLKRGASRGTTFSLRPGVNNFMDYLFDHHEVMIYSSARPENVQGMVQKLFHPKQREKLVAVWARDKLGLNKAQYFSKVQCYKNLEKIWADASIQRRAGTGRKWDQTNTVLLDDSHLKAKAQPYNLLRIEEFTNDRPFNLAANGKVESPEQAKALSTWNAAQRKILLDILRQVTALEKAQDVSKLIRSWQLAEMEKSGQMQVGQKQIQLPTPVSSEAATSDDDQSDGGVDVARDDSYEPPEHIEQTFGEQRTIIRRDDGLSDRSASPIDETVWKEILGGAEDGRDGP